MASVFLLPSCCSFWFPVRETGGFFKGWPRFIAVRHSFCVPAGGTVDAQTVMLTASPVLCCAAWETALEYQWIFFLYQLSLSFYLPFSLSPSIFIQIFCSPFAIRYLFLHIHLFLSVAVLIFSWPVSFCGCLFASQPLLLFELRAVSSSSRSELCSHLSHHWGEETSFIDAAPFSLFLCFTVSGHLVLALFTTVVPVVLDLSSLIFPKIPIWLFFPKCQAVSLHRVASFQ